MTGYARNSDPKTSHEAATAATKKHRPHYSRLAVAAALASTHRPLADPEIYYAVYRDGQNLNEHGRPIWSASRLRHARLELEKAGHIERAGFTRLDGTNYMTFALRDPEAYLLTGGITHG